MVSIFILVFAVIALVRFGISQWRAIWMSAANQPLSESLQLASGIDEASIGAGDFGTFPHWRRAKCRSARAMRQSFLTRVFP